MKYDLVTFAPNYCGKSIASIVWIVNAFLYNIFKLRLFIFYGRQKMNIGTISCIVMGGIFGILAVVFALLKEKGAMLISGFNTLPKEEREKYNKAKMSIDQRNSFIIWTVIFIVGAFVSNLVNAYLAIIAFVIWLFLFLKEVHLDTDKAFGKYKK